MSGVESTALLLLRLASPSSAAERIGIGALNDARPELFCVNKLFESTAEDESGAPAAASRIFLGGGDQDITISGNTLTNVRSQAIRVSDLGFYPTGNRAITITDNLISVDVASQTAPTALIDLLGGNGVNRRLDLARRHARVEDDDVRAEVRWARTGARIRGRNPRGGQRGSDRG